MSWDPDVDWQLSAIATRTWKGENDLGEPYVPGAPRPDVASLEGVVELTDDVTGSVRWWPASGVDLLLAAGWQRAHAAGHVPGADRSGLHASAAFRLVR